MSRPLGALLLGCVAALALAMPAVPARAAEEQATYDVRGPSPWLYVRAVEGPGYRVSLSSPDGRSLQVKVTVDDIPFAASPPYPIDAASRARLPADALAALQAPSYPELEVLSRKLLRGSGTVLQAIEHVVAFTARRIAYELPTAGRTENARSCYETSRGSCVGRSLLAVDILRRGGIPARTVSGVLTAAGPEELSKESRLVYDEPLGGVLHRWIEAYVPGLGWVGSDPGGLANTLSSRHLPLASFPSLEFGVRLRERSRPITWEGVKAFGTGRIFGRRLTRGLAEAADAMPMLERPR